MTDVKELKSIVQNRIEMERERAQLQDQIPVIEKNIKKFTYIADESQTSYENLENSKLQMFFLGLVGKKEERLQDAQNEARKTRGDLAAAKFELNSTKDRIEAITLELNVTESVFDEYIGQLEGIEGAEMKERMIALKKLQNLRYLINEKIKETKAVFIKAEEIWVYGDIQTDLSGRRYNNKYTTLRNHAILIKKALSELIALLKQYNTYAPEETKINFHEDWMDDEKYWDGQQIAEISHDRIKKVDDWFYRFETCWNKMKKQQNEAEEILRSEVLEYLKY